MKMHYNRRLLQNDTTFYSHTNKSKQFLLSSTHTNTTSSIIMNPPSFSSRYMSTSMALTIVVIVAAIFFLGLFSVYIRYTSKQTLSQTPPPRRRHQRRRTSPTSSTNSSPTSTGSSSSTGHVNPSTAKSLPLIAYCEAKQEEEPLDCVVCLGEFQQGENVKMIPGCGHVFHPDCIDTWLSFQASCPLCRSTQLLPLPPDEKKEISLRIVENPETSGEGESVGRTNSQCNRNTSVAVGERILLQRSISL